VNSSFADLCRTFTDRELSSLPGDRQQRHGAFRPFLANLDGGRLVYHERFTALVDVVTMSLTQAGFEFEVRSLATIRRWDRGVMRPVPDRWRFGNTWEFCTLSPDRRALDNHPTGFRLWVEPDLVRQVEELVAAGEVMAADALLHDGTDAPSARVQVA
jgi:hypothetical protein